VGGLLFPRQAEGSLIERDGKAIGSVLVGQPFSGGNYFHGRPSAANYDPRATGGSNLAPDNPALRERVAADSARIQQLEGVKPAQIPVDLLAASGAGLDPHISPQAAELQIARIATARGLHKQQIAELVASHTEGPQLGLFGQPRVNVLMLNLALDELPEPVAAAN
jgi:K+-transporting ATPase ATPase C chain